MGSAMCHWPSSSISSRPRSSSPEGVFSHWVSASNIETGTRMPSIVAALAIMPDRRALDCCWLSHFQYRSRSLTGLPSLSTYLTATARDIASVTASAPITLSANSSTRPGPPLRTSSQRCPSKAYSPRPFWPSTNRILPP